MRFLAATLVALLALELKAQFAATASLEGTVRDHGGTLLPNVPVLARNLATLSLRHTVTDGAGAYYIPFLQPGAYEVTAGSAAFATAVSERVPLAVGEYRRIDFALRPTLVKEIVTVRADAPLIETTTAATGQIIDAAELRNLPVNLRNFVQLALITPKVVPASVAVSRGYMGERYRENQFSFSGVRFQFNHLTIDGAGAVVYSANALKSFYSYESVQEFRVLNGLFTAEHGHATGGVVNVVTRSGSNVWHGAAYDYLRNARMDRADLLSPGRPPFRRNQFGVSGEGPLRRDKLFLFANYEGRRQARSPRFPAAVRDNIGGINAALRNLGFPEEKPDVLQTSDEDEVLVRTDLTPAGKHHGFARYNFFDGRNLRDRIGSPGAAGDPVTSLAARDHYLRDQGATAGLFSVYPKFVNHAGVSFQRHSYALEPQPGTRRIELAVLGAFSTGFEGADELANRERRWHVWDNAAKWRRAHEWRFGGEYTHTAVRHLPSSVSLAVIPGLAAFLAPRPVVAQVYFSRPSPLLPLRADQPGFFVHHQWRAAGSLTLTSGVRYDIERVSGMIAVSRQDWNNVQPRLGFAWAPGAARSTVVRGGAGLFTADRLHPLLLLDGWGHGLGFPAFNEEYRGANPFARLYRPLPDTTAPAIVAGVGPASAAFDAFLRSGTVPDAAGSRQVIQISHPALPNPSAAQWGLTIERQVLPDLAASLGYSGLAAYDLPLVLDRNLRPAAARLPNGKNDYAATGLAADARLFDPRFGSTLIAEPRGRSSYHAATAALRKRFAQGFRFGTHYVFSRSIDNGSGASISMGPEDTYDLGRERALSSEHARHRFVTSGTAETHGFLFAMVGVYQSPRYYNVTAGSDLNRDQRPTTDRPGLLGRNTFRGDDYFAIDVRLGRDFRFRERYRLRLSADVFNLLNRVNVTDISTVYGRSTLDEPPVATFNTPRGVANALQTQAGLRIEF